MTPRLLFEQLWSRGDELALLYDNLVNIGIPQPRADELLRAEWVTRLAALDLYVHELLASRMVSQFESGASKYPGFSSFRLSAEAMWRVVRATSPSERSAAFDLDVRAQISHLTFQMPDKIADAVRYTSDVQLWKEVARHQNPTASQAELKEHQKTLNTELSSMVQRRNKIAHEGDLGPSVPREKLPIALEQLELVRDVVRRLVDSIEHVVEAHDVLSLAPLSLAEMSVVSHQTVEGTQPNSAQQTGQAEVSELAESRAVPVVPDWVKFEAGGKKDGLFW
ncbi:hypothetical protein FJU31_03975 [Stenotrophomonas cyclobalanopsidis]|uniref:RiboL-PSP-HEPN domain-containing protein n=1 Tax=Stenotrophomonas cyclobalanopsidis TaxID=2771362 RepID=A0ABQ6T4K2_9GAMM|nr:HEPN domain-containing protein [Stenotrophomonas cyclobalanopsidis]KAA9003471.1 hypothetical protein FJU31_03975 [Stenotrophomonas cyclobalanopsidis]